MCCAWESCGARFGAPFHDLAHCRNHGRSAARRSRVPRLLMTRKGYQFAMPALPAATAMECLKTIPRDPPLLKGGEIRARAASEPVCQASIRNPNSEMQPEVHDSSGAVTDSNRIGPAALA